ncbi:hypothetical protein FBU30_000502 [Linnemannia zychae]|nr:hypothetical protein FBU30_000502 [Linnemannia zychae]
MEADQELTDSLSDWQPPASNIQLPQLQSALAHRFLDWALSEDILSLHSPKSVYDDDETVHKASETAENNSALSVAGGEESSKVSGLEYLQGREQRERSIITAGQDWAVAHDLVWPEGDYYMAKKIFIREGVAHLKRGRRYIFVEPVVGPATSYLYPKWVESEEDELESAAYEQRQSQEGHSAENSMHSMHDATTAVDSFPALNSSNASPTDNSILDANVNTPVQSSLASSQFTAASSSNDTETEQDKNQGDDIFLDQQQQSHSNEVSAILESGHGNNRDVGGEDGKESNKENEESAQETQHDESCHNASSPVSLEDDRAQDDLVPPLSPTTITTLGNMDGERIEKEDSDDTSNTTSNNNNNTATSNANSPQSSSSTPSSSSLTRSSFEEASSSLQQQQSTEFLKPYSPLLDPSTDGQDQFEYGLYELQYIPKIQYLLPSQFLPSRHSFIVHLDEDRPTLASPVPAHSKRSECRCQLMMRKVLMHRDLLQVWPPIPPIRTIQERQQEAEEEARMMEIKQKVQLLTSNWRKTLQTQMVAC